MRVQLAQQVQELVGTSELGIITARVDDVALLSGHMVQMGFVEVLARHIPRPWQQRERSGGWTAVSWLASILTEGDHRTVSVEAYIQGMHHTLSHLSGPVITPLDFSDDRLGHRLKHLSKPTSGHAIEQELHARSLEVYALSQDVLRCDATTVSGTHAVRAGGLLPCGPSKDDSRRPQIKVMMGALDPLGMPLATEVLAGERADDGWYMPLIQRLEAGLSQPGLLFVGACKLSALGTRAYGVGRQPMSLSPVPCTGATAEARAAWSSEGIAPGRAGALERLFRRNHRDEEALVAEGDACASSCGLEEGEAEWTARVVVVRSPAHAERQAAGLEKRLAPAEHKLAALTPARGRGKRQITEAAQLVAALAKVLKEQQGEGWLQVEWPQPIERHTPYVGRGRGSATRQQRGTEHTRAPLTRLTRQDGPSSALTQRFGWKAFVTNAPPERLSLRDAILGYRHAYRIERLCNRLKSRGHIAPLFVTLNDQIEGLTDLRTLGVRVLTVMEFALRRSLRNAHAKLPGLPPENKTKMTDTPTAERILKAFADVSLTIIKQATGEGILRQLTPLSGVQETILQCLGLGTSLYRQLEIQGIGN
jgi:transposase